MMDENIDYFDSKFEKFENLLFFLIINFYKLYKKNFTNKKIFLSPITMFHATMICIIIIRIELFEPSTKFNQ